MTDRYEKNHAARVDVTWPLSILEAGYWREVYMGTKHMRLEVSYPYETWERLMAALAAAQQQLAGDGCHCATCTCNPSMTPAVRFDLSPAQKEGAIREHLIRLGWTPPDEHALSQPAVHPAITHCDNCGCDWLDNGLNPVGCPYCKQNAWRAAFVAERATRYREGGMAVEQARIHAETEAAYLHARADLLRDQEEGREQ
jgi:hypothetical protein